MLLEIRREDGPSLTAYAAIPIAYDVREALQLPIVGTAPFARRIVRPPYRKDYDVIPGNHPCDWPARFAVDRAEFVAAYADGERVGGAVAVVEPSDVERLGGDPRLALLWDLRVAPHARRRGVGRALLARIEERLQDTGIAGIAVETQDINLAACQLYCAAGFVITSVEANTYHDLPEETRIVWTKIFRLASARHPANDRCG